MEVNTPDKDERIVITKEKIAKEKLPPYNLVGNGLSNRHGTSLDIIDVCVQLNIAELRLLQFFRNEFTYACIRGENKPNEIIPTKCDSWDAYLRVALKKNYLHMEYVRLVVRISRGKYLLNPYLFMYSKGYGVVQEQWDNLIDNLKENR